MCASPPHIQGKSRMRQRARTDPCGGRSVMVVPTATSDECRLSAKASETDTRLRGSSMRIAQRGGIIVPGEAGSEPWGGTENRRPRRSEQTRRVNPSRTLFRRRAARNDGAARPPLGWRLSALSLEDGSVGAPDCPSPTLNVSGSDGSSQRSSEGVDTSSAR
jgi:hypothetical protein